MSHGRFATGQVSRDLINAKVSCKKTRTGPDPYNINTANLWNTRTGSPRFAVEGGESRVWMRPRPDCSRSLNLDPYAVATRENPWMSFGRTSRPAPALGRGPNMGRSASPRTANFTGSYYFSPFPENRAHTPRTPQTTGRRMWTPVTPGANTEPAGSKAWDWGGVSPGGLSSPATLPPLPAACRF